jgi:hypothetical protein
MMLHSLFYSWFINMKIALGDIQLSKIILMKLILHLNSLPLFYTNINIIIRRINFYCNQTLWVISYLIWFILVVIFSPHESLITDLSIYNCYLRLFMYPKVSIRTGTSFFHSSHPSNMLIDLYLYIAKTRDENETNTCTTIELQEPTMIQHRVSEIKQYNFLI